VKAIIKKDSSPGLEIQEIDKPSPGPLDVIVKIKKSSICGTDIHIYDWDDWSSKTIKPPMQIGHEWTGVVDSVGSEVKKYKQGDRVSGEGHVVCGECRNCKAGKRHLCIDQHGIGVHLPGAFAEFLKIPATNLFSLPDSIPDKIATIFDPLGNAVHATLSYDLVGEDVLITGAGPIGMMSALIAQNIGARHVVVTDINDYRLNLCKELGIQHAYHASTNLRELMPSLNMHEGFDVALEMSGSPSALNDIISNVKNGAKIALLGILPEDTKISWNEVIFKDLFIKGIYGREIFETWYKMVSMLESGLNVDHIITHEFHYTEFEEAVQIMKSGQSGKIILNWES
jgi:threonine 3-dehydrogenase